MELSSSLRTNPRCSGNSDNDFELVSFTKLVRSTIDCLILTAETGWRLFVSSSHANYFSIDESQGKPSSSGALASWKGLTPRFFEGLEAEEISAVLSAATQKNFPAKCSITNQGSRADYLFLLTAGRARYFFVTKGGRKHILLWLPPGEVFGTTALLTKPSVYIVSTETVQPSYMLVWKRATIRNLAKRYPRLVENALSIASDYLSMYVATHIALTSHTARQRLAQVLANLASGFGHKVLGGIELDVTNEDLADAANVTHFTASRLLSEWNRSGALIKRRGKILLRSTELLFRDTIEE